MKHSTFEKNKIAGAVLAVVLVVLAGRELASIIYHQPDPEKPGFVIEVAEAVSDSAVSKQEVVPIANLLAAADVEAGKKVAKKCLSCHSFAKDGANKTGPHLWGVVNRAIASIGDFNYSTAMKDKADKSKTWSYDHLDAYLKKPAASVPKTKMVFAGIKKHKDRANLILYLRSLSDNPAPLPEPVPEPVPQNSGDDKDTSDSADTSGSPAASDAPGDSGSGDSGSGDADSAGSGEDKITGDDTGAAGDKADASQ